MNVSKISEAKAFEVKPGRARRILHTDHLMMVAFDFADGPAAQPDPPHTHPHEQVTYVAEGEVMFFIGEESTRLAPGDMVAVPARSAPPDSTADADRPADRHLHAAASGFSLIPGILKFDFLKPL